MQCRVCGKAKLKAGKSFDMHMWWHKERSRRSSTKRTPNDKDSVQDAVINNTPPSHLEETMTALEGRRDELLGELDTVNAALVAVAFLINKGKESK